MDKGCKFGHVNQWTISGVALSHCRLNSVLKLCPVACDVPTTKALMISPRLRTLPATICTVALLFAGPALAQSSESKGGDQQKPPTAADAAQERQRRIDEFTEAQRMLSGAAGQPECVWLGRRIVSLLWRDDLDTAFRHFDLYDRFGCPGGHIQTAFRCLVRNGNIDPKVPEALNSRVHSCWVNPNLAAAPAPAVAAPASGAPPAGGEQKR
jgi:hypothetical protein